MEAKHFRSIYLNVLNAMDHSSKITNNGIAARTELECRPLTELKTVEQDIAFRGRSSYFGLASVPWRFQSIQNIVRTTNVPFATVFDG